MQLTPKQLLEMADFARLKLSQSEQEDCLLRLNAFLEHARVIDSLDLSGVEPSIHMTEAVNVFREDTKGSTLAPEDVFSNAPDHAMGFFRVPRTVEGQ